MLPPIVGESWIIQRHDGELGSATVRFDGGLIHGLVYVAGPALGPMHMRLIGLMQVTRQGAACEIDWPVTALSQRAIASDPTWLSAISRGTSPPFGQLA